MKNTRKYYLTIYCIVLVLCSCETFNKYSNIDDIENKTITNNKNIQYRTIKTGLKLVKSEYWLYEFGYEYNNKNQISHSYYKDYEYYKNDGSLADRDYLTKNNEVTIVETISQQEFYIDGLLVEEITPITYGIGTDSYTSTHRKIEYYKDINKNIIEEKSKDVLDKTITNWRRFLYDDKNRKIESQELSKDGKKTSNVIKYEYYDNNALKREYFINKDGIYRQIEYEYFNQGKIIKIFSDKELSLTSTYLYDERGNIIKEENKSSSPYFDDIYKKLYGEDPYVSIVDYKYDDRNNKIYTHYVVYNLNKDIIYFDRETKITYNIVNQPLTYQDYEKVIDKANHYTERKSESTTVYSDDFLIGTTFSGKTEQDNVAVNTKIYEMYFDNK